MNKGPGKTNFPTNLSTQIELFPLWIFHPQEPIRALWDFFILLIMIYIIVEIPVQLCFEMPADPAWKSIDYFVDSIFFADIFFNFNTAYVNKEEKLVTSRQKIAKKYLRSMFWFDVITSIPFEALLTSRKVSQITKILKIFRILRLLKIFRVMKVLAQWEENSETGAMFMRVLKCGALFFLIAHTAACFFVGVESFYRSSDRSFENYYGFHEKSWFVRFQDTWAEPQLTHYLRSLYWTFTTLTTVGYGDVTPLLPLEILFTIFIQCIGCSLFGFIYYLTRDDGTAARIKEKMNSVREYIRYRKIPKCLGHKIHRHYLYAWKRTQVFKEEEILFELPHALRAECSLFVHQDIIKKVPLFSQLGQDVVPSLVSRLKPALASKGDVIVKEGLIGDEMYVVSVGYLVVSVEVATSLKEGSDSKHEELIIKKMKAGDYFAEYAVIMAQAKHPATVTSVSYADIFALQRADFLTFGEQFPLAWTEIVRESKERYFELVNMIMKERRHHIFMLGLQLRDSEGLGSALLDMHMYKRTLRPEDLSRGLSLADLKSDQNLHHTESTAKLSIKRLEEEMKAAPVVSFAMRLKYHQLVKSGGESACPSSIFKPLQKLAIPNYFKSIFKSKKHHDSRPFSPGTAGYSEQKNEIEPTIKIGPHALEKIWAWKDRAQLKVIMKKLEKIEDRFSSGKPSEYSDLSHKALSSMNSSIQREIQDLTQMVKKCNNEVYDLKGLVYLALGPNNKKRSSTLSKSKYSLSEQQSGNL